jgi:hypothetical protein
MLRVGNLMHKNLAQVMEYRHVRYIRCLTRQKKKKKKNIANRLDDPYQPMVKYWCRFSSPSTRLALRHK